MIWIFVIIGAVVLFLFLSKGSGEQTITNRKDGDIYTLASMRHIQQILVKDGLTKGSSSYQSEANRLVDNYINRNFNGESEAMKQGRKDRYMGILMNI
ncbi:hypothetical protein [Adhaeribacter aquaticus]|uniref:hypothetical protein n=1 Tax=Adhaeribacter aquaticus TaxID=299567 RepID=UPI00047B66A9|nr:hypothetical protein [Adhaeribacter aquaticus]